MPKIEKIFKQVLRGLRILFVGFGGFAVLFIILAFTDWPWFARARLGATHAQFKFSPKTIVLMGAGGFPSNAVLMRVWFTAQLALKYPDAKIVVANPGDTLSSVSTSILIKHAIVHYGIDSTRICFESTGLNTRYQAMMLYAMMQSGEIDDSLVIVTSPEHIFRAVKAFEKVGFKYIGSKATTESMLEINLQTDFDSLDKTEFTPDMGHSISVRYSMWEYMKYEIDILREYVAISYYKLNRWI